MGRKSTIQHKNMYQICREDAGLTREAAASELVYVNEDRLYRIEHGASPAPDEVLLMAEAYHAPMLPNYYCTTECDIGKKCIPVATPKPLPQITLEMLAILNKLSNEKERLIEITYDGKISEDERAEFQALQDKLAAMASVISSLQLWVDEHLS